MSNPLNSHDDNTRWSLIPVNPAVAGAGAAGTITSMGCCAAVHRSAPKDDFDHNANNSNSNSGATIVQGEEEPLILAGSDAGYIHIVQHSQCLKSFALVYKDGDDAHGGVIGGDSDTGAALQQHGAQSIDLLHSLVAPPDMHAISVGTDTISGSVPDRATLCIGFVTRPSNQVFLASFIDKDKHVSSAHQILPATPSECHLLHLSSNDEYNRGATTIMCMAATSMALSSIISTGEMSSTGSASKQTLHCIVTGDSQGFAQLRVIVSATPHVSRLYDGGGVSPFGNQFHHHVQAHDGMCTSAFFLMLDCNNEKRIHDTDHFGFFATAGLTERIATIRVWSFHLDHQCCNNEANTPFDPSSKNHHPLRVSNIATINLPAASSFVTSMASYHCRASNETYLLTGTATGRLHIWRFERKRSESEQFGLELVASPTGDLNSHQSSIDAIAVCPNSTTTRGHPGVLLTGDSEGVLRLYRSQNQTSASSCFCLDKNLKQAAQVSMKSPIISISVSSEMPSSCKGHPIFAATKAGQIKRWDQASLPKLPPERPAPFHEQKVEFEISGGGQDDVPPHERHDNLHRQKADNVCSEEPKGPLPASTLQDDKRHLSNSYIESDEDVTMPKARPSYDSSVSPTMSYKGSASRTRSDTMRDTIELPRATPKASSPPALVIRTTSKANDDESSFDEMKSKDSEIDLGSPTERGLSEHSLMTKQAMGRQSTGSKTHRRVLPVQHLLSGQTSVTDRPKSSRTPQTATKKIQKPSMHMVDNTPPTSSSRRPLSDRKTPRNPIKFVPTPCPREETITPPVHHSARRFPFATGGHKEALQTPPTLHFQHGMSFTSSMQPVGKQHQSPSHRNTTSKLEASKHVEVRETHLYLFCCS
jgi:hypothetical protein